MASRDHPESVMDGSRMWGKRLRVEILPHLITLKMKRGKQVHAAASLWRREGTDLGIGGIGHLWRCYISKWIVIDITTLGLPQTNLCWPDKSDGILINEVGRLLKDGTGPGCSPAIQVFDDRWLTPSPPEPCSSLGILTKSTFLSVL